MIAIAGGSLFIDQRDASANGADVRHGPCAVFGTPNPLPGTTDLSAFEPYIDQSELPIFAPLGVPVLWTDTGKIVVNKNRTNVQCHADLSVNPAFVHAPQSAVVVPFTCNGPSIRGTARLTPSGILTINCHWDFPLPLPPA